MSAYRELLQQLSGVRHRWLVTGAAGFIGSHLVETLLRANQEVVGLDNFATGSRTNIEHVHAAIGDAGMKRFRFIEGDIRDPAICRKACARMDYVLHQAALGSVPRSIAQPDATHQSNVDGFLNMLIAARDAEVRRFVYASSSSVYGDHPDLPKLEPKIGKPLSPYAASKLIDEIYAGVFGSTYGMMNIGLRYFNVFGPRQDPNGAYAAVVPRWMSALIRGEPVQIFGDGETSRDFCYVDNAVQANLLAATTSNEKAFNRVFNVAVGERTSLNQLFVLQRSLLEARYPDVARAEPRYAEFRSGDVRHSLADISMACSLLNYCPSHRIEEGLRETVSWYVANLVRADACG